MNKPDALDYDGRYRDIISDPINVFINRVPEAGIVYKDHVYLHNGIRVPFSGNLAYYEDFSKILIYNRGVHEPLEEFIFQELIKRLPQNPVMIELGAYWGHYSMWMKKERPNANIHLVEADSNNIEVGKNNLKNQNMDATFILQPVGVNGFIVDKYINNFDKVNLLHSDIQGYEIEMLEGATESLNKFKIDYLMISTHSEDLHKLVLKKLKKHKYRIEVSSGFNETLSHDGFILASSPNVNKIVRNWKPIERLDLLNMTQEKIVKFIIETKKVFKL